MKKIFYLALFIFLIGVVGGSLSLHADDSVCRPTQVHFRKIQPEFNPDPTSPAFTDDRVEILTGWSGDWPWLQGNGGPDGSQYIVHNGGLPHLGQMTIDDPNDEVRDHFEKLEYAINYLMPDPNWDGYAVFNMEYWHPIWERLLDGHAPWPKYQTEMRRWVRKKDPSLSEENVETVARVLWETGAREWMEKTLKRAQELRPRAKWGYYAFPDRVYFDQGTYVWGNPQTGVGVPQERKDMNQGELKWLFDKMDAVFPSVYQLFPSYGKAYDSKSGLDNVPCDPDPRFDFSVYPEGRRKANEEYLRENVQEAKRISQFYDPPKDIVAFTWSLYHPSHNCAYKRLTPFDYEMMLRVSYEEGVDGFFTWIAGVDPQVEKDYFKTVVQPIVEKKISANDCWDRQIIVANTPGGGVVPSGVLTAPKDSTVDVYIQPDGDHLLKKILLDGESIEVQPHFELNKIRKNHLVQVFFEPIEPEAPTSQIYVIHRLNNTASPNVEIKFNLVSNDVLSLVILDSRGQVVNNILTFKMGPADGSVIWRGLNNQGERVASGSYTLLSNLKGISETRKIAFIW